MSLDESPYRYPHTISIVPIIVDVYKIVHKWNRNEV